MSSRDDSLIYYSGIIMAVLGAVLAAVAIIKSLLFR